MVPILVTVMTFTMTTIATGWTNNFPALFARNWIIGIIVALPTALIVSKPVNKITKKIIKKQETKKQ
jgi:hypothetical protein